MTTKDLVVEKTINKPHVFIHSDFNLCFWLKSVFVAQEGFGLVHLHTKEFVNLSSLLTVTIQGELPRGKEMRSPKTQGHILPCSSLWPPCMAPWL